MSFLVPWLAHRKVVREGDAGDAGGGHPALHGERHGRDAPTFDSLADQAHGPVAERSGRSQQDGVGAVFDQLAGDLRGRFLRKWGRFVDGAHEGEVAVVQATDKALFD